MSGVVFCTKWFHLAKTLNDNYKYSHSPKSKKTWIWGIEKYTHDIFTKYKVIMKIIKRDYLQKVISLIGTSDIKVITWVRRSWKSELLESFAEYLNQNIEDCNIIKINFNLLDFDNLRDYKKLNEYVESRYLSSKRNFVLIDEVQMCNNFESTINSLHASKKYDIYITWSNAFLLSSDLATLFTGRTYEIKIFPFSFQEFIEYYQYEDNQKAFAEFVRQWWMAWSYQYKTQEQKDNYLLEVYNALIVRDIKTKYKIKYTDLLDNLSDFLIDNISNITSIRKVTNEFKSKWITIDHKTISAYINYLCNAFLFYQVKRYDIQWKKYLSMQNKYYLVDQWFKFARLWTKNMNYWRVYENLVAIELLRRGYEVYVGVLNQKEIDFVALKQDEKIYIQVSDNISEEKTLHREVAPLLEIRDAYPKILIARTNHEVYQYEWIKIIDIADWLSHNKI